MLVLTRKKDQSLVINDNIEITVLEIQGDQVRIGINAPKSVTVHRKEVYLEILEENRKAANIGNVKLDELLARTKQDGAAQKAGDNGKSNGDSSKKDGDEL